MIGIDTSRKNASQQPRGLMHARIIPAALTLVMALILTAWACFANHKVGMASAREVFEQDWEARLAKTRNDFEIQLNLTYDAIRTMAMLPGVSTIDRYAENFKGDPRMTVQQLYNNIASHVQVSEIYIVPADMEPDQLDPRTGKLQEPITTFDQIIVGRSADQMEHGENAEELEEVEIFEYREMKKQCERFATAYPTRDSIKGLNYPALTSREVVTCDNTEFSSAQLADHDDRARNGIVYSVPFYGPDGKFKGIVSAVLRTWMISRTIKEPYFALAYPQSNFSTFSPRFPEDSESARADMSMGRKPMGYAFARANRCEVRDEAPWIITCAVPERVFAATAAARAVKTRGNILLGGGVAISILLAFVIWSLSTLRWRAESLARRMTSDLARSESRFRALVENIPGAVYRSSSLDRQRLEYVSEGVAGITGCSASSLMSSPSFSLSDMIAPEDRVRVESELRSALVSSSTGHFLSEYRLQRADGQVCWVQDRGHVVRSGNERHIEGLLLDITDRRNAEAERERMHHELQKASRRAGMAEIATGVLHNVGNVLNSLNVSACFVSEKLRQSKVTNLGKAAQMLGEHKDDLADFLTSDERGRRLPGYVIDIARSLADEQTTLLDELKTVGKNIEHIRAIVDTQQSYAKGSTLLSPIQPAELLEHAARVSIASFERHNIKLSKEIIDVPAVMIDQHKVLQILINLVGNAKKAVAGVTDRHVRLRLESVPEPADDCAGKLRLRFQVIDNGVGIPPENLSRIFSHGFTTGKNGHGFGLHSSANAAGEMGGKLTASSEGPGRGATFTLEIPVQCASSLASQSSVEVAN